MTRSRCLVVVDDLHWADPASRDLLGLLLRRCDRLSLAAAYLPGGTAARFSAAEAFGIPAALVEQITLGPLPDEALRGLFSDPVLARIIMDAAGSVPFAVTEIIAALAAQGAIHRDGNRGWRLGPRADVTRARAAASAGCAT